MDKILCKLITGKYIEKKEEQIKRLTHVKMMIILFIMFYLLFPQTALAYIDPGTGSYILQFVLAAFLGIAFTIKIFWTKVRIFVVNLFSKKSKNI